MRARLYAAGWMMGWALSFSIAMLCNKSISPQLPTTVVVWMRCAFGLLFLAPLLWKHRYHVWSTRLLGFHILRGSFMTGAMMCTYLAYRHLPAHTAATLGTTGPLFTVLLSALILRERMGPIRWMALGLGYSGVLLIIQPHRFMVNIYALLSLVGNLALALSVITGRYLARHHQSTATTLFYGTIIPFVFYTLAQGISLPSFGGTSDWTFLAGVGFAGALCQLCYFRALKLAPASFLAPFEYLRLCIMIPLSWIFFHEAPHQSIFLGISLVLGANCLLMLVDRQR